MAVLKYKDDSGYFIEIMGLSGPRGERGEKGDKGDKGDTGDGVVNIVEDNTTERSYVLSSTGPDDNTLKYHPGVYID